jgi:hypothetical protein
VGLGDDVPIDEDGDAAGGGCGFEGKERHEREGE